ncbi:MAG: hypothetical protein WAN48_00350 [Actinomycetes bacterium]
MTKTKHLHNDRAQLAEDAWSALPHGGHDAVRLQVHCARSHHVASVYDTTIGLVYAAPVRGRSHGERDLPDKPHGDQHPHRWFDLLVGAPAGDDSLPAWCDCGPRTLSRAAVLTWVDDGEHRVVVD